MEQEDKGQQQLTNEEEEDTFIEWLMVIVICTFVGWIVATLWYLSSTSFPSDDWYIAFGFNIIILLQILIYNKK